MTLTKEQRKAIALLLVASDRTKVGNFDLEDEQNARTILRAMIDSSGKVGTPPEEAEWKSDLEVLDRGTRSGLINIEIAKKWHAAYRKAQNSNLLRKQENERLLEALDESEKVVAHKTKSAAHWYDEHLQARVDLVQTRRVIYQRDAKIKELEDALSEYQRLGKTIAGRVPCLVPHGDCGRCSADAREVCGALEQIADGKIGPEDA
jgi:hypothetical protein